MKADNTTINVNPGPTCITTLWLPKTEPKINRRAETKGAFGGKRKTKKQS